MKAIDTYNVVPGLEFLADNPEFLTRETALLVERCNAIYIPKAYIQKLLDFGIEHPDDERYPGLLKIFGDILEQPDQQRHICHHPIIIQDLSQNSPEKLRLSHYDQSKHEYQAVCLALQLKHEHRVAILTDHDGLRALALSDHIPVIRESRQTYTGRYTITLPEDQAETIDYENGIQLSEWQNIVPDKPELKPNEFAVFEHQYSNRFHVLRYDAPNRCLAPCTAKKYSPGILNNIVPRNPGQAIILEALLAPVEDIPIVIIEGAFGTGKTFLTAAVGYAGIESKRYDRIVICPRDSRLGDDIGAVPGDTFDKTRTKAHSVIDNLQEVIRLVSNVKNGKFASYVENVLSGYCDFVPLTEVGGRSLARSFIICDEFQDMSRQQARAVMTRVGEGSKLVLIGDLHQINNSRLTSTSCGLAYAIKHLAGKPEIAFVSMGSKETTRSAAAKALAKYL